MDALTLWRRYRQHLVRESKTGISLDASRASFPDDLFLTAGERWTAAHTAMRDLEAGDIANPDEQRMVGHYWLRAPHLAPTDELRTAIEQTVVRIKQFAEQVHSRAITPPDQARFTDLLVIGIGGSALGPQLVADALGTRRDKLQVHFLDNTDPDGIDRTLSNLGARLKSTLVLVISKSGGTPETRNGMLETQHAYRSAGLDFARCAVAVTSDGSKLDQLATEQNWLARFPMWDWVGGRTSVLSAVGLLPAALQGLDIDGLLEGAAAMDENTRGEDLRTNLAGRLALLWHQLTDGRGSKDMVILPYKDRLLLLSRYLQQLIMESLGKELDLNGQPVHQGIAVYGNKGSTDQHAYVQQLRDGVDNFFATFIVVQQDRTPAAAKKAADVEPGITSGDYLLGFWQGTRQALHEKGRSSLTLTLAKLTPQTLGGLIALFERAVGYYAALVNINAYHQPGVEAGKKAASAVLALQTKLTTWLASNTEPMTCEQMADRMGCPHDVEAIYHLLEHLAENGRGVKRVRDKYKWTG